MKKAIFYFIVATMLLSVSCSKGYDDSALVGRVDNLENRVAKLEDLCMQMNTNISSLQAIVAAVQKNDYITGVAPITIDGNTVGYTITFAKSQPITIYHGEDGEDGKNGVDGKDGVNGIDGSDGHTPIVGVKQDEDGIYYWTLDGDWLYDSDGNKIKAQGIDGKDGENGIDGEDGENGTDGKDGISPQLKIENGYWYISYDNGSTWTQYGKAAGEDGDSFFESIDTSDSEYVVFTLSDGTSIILQRHDKSIVAQIDDIIYVPQYSDGKVTLKYSIIENSYAEVDIEIIPAEISYIIAENPRLISARAVYTKTRAESTYIDMPILKVTSNDGILTVKTSGINLDSDVFNGIIDAQISIMIADETSSIATDFVPMTVVRDNEIETNNILTYTSTNEATLEPCNIAAFDADIVSNTYKNGLGVIVFDADITTIGDNAFNGHYSESTQTRATDANSLTTITIPRSVTSIGDSAFIGNPSLSAFYGQFSTDDNRALVVENRIVAFAPYEISKYSIPSGVTEIAPNTFCGCEGLTYVSIPKTVTAIGESAFDGCSNLSAIFCNSSTPPSGRENMFDNCNEDLTIYVPDEVVEIYYSADYWSEYMGAIAPASNLATSIKYSTTDGNIVDVLATDGFGATLVSNTYDRATDTGLLQFDGGVKSIPAEAFYACVNLKNIEIPMGIQSIGDGAFKNCYNIQNITLPESVSSIGNSAFESVGGVAEINCEIPAKAFMCSAFTHVKVGNNVTCIGEQAFASNPYMVEFDMGDGVTKIYPKAFYGCTSLETVYLSVNLKEFISPGNQFGNCTSLHIKDFSNFCRIKNNDGVLWNCDLYLNGDKVVDLIVPDDISADEIDSDIFRRCASIESATISANSQHLSLSHCPNLKKLTFKEGVTTLSGYSYIPITDLVLPNSLTYIENGTFKGCSNLSSVTLGTGITYIGKDCFLDCVNLKSIYAPSTEVWFNISFGSSPMFDPRSTNMEEYEGVDLYFDGKLVVDLVVPDIVTQINPYAFSGCKSIQKITFGRKVTSLGYMAFKYCENLKEINIPETISYIGDGAFLGCGKVESVSLHKYIKYIGDSVFDGCGGVLYADFDFLEWNLPPNPNPLIYQNFVSYKPFYWYGDFTNASFSEIVIGDGVTTITAAAFSYNKSLRTITLPDTVKHIEEGAFYECEALESIKLPESLESIGQEAFRTSALKSIYCKNTIPPTISTNSVGGNIETIYVPISSVDAYKVADGWKDYADLINGCDFFE